MGTSLADLLTGYLTSRQMSQKKLAAATGLNPSTVDRWVDGENARIQRWQDLAKIARALGLDRAQTTELLMAGGQPSLAVLARRGLEDADRTLLAHWPNHLPPSTLPAPLSRFIGRDQERTDLVGILGTDRMVTISGTGGSGKTRLAIEVARALQPRFDGTYFVDLAAIHDPDRVVSAIADVVGFRPSDEESNHLVSALAAYLHGHLVLLVLDNVEQVLAAGPRIVALLEAVTSVTVIVTSRTFLHVRGEREYAVDPLPLPPPAAGYEDLVVNPAVALFADRAQHANRHVHLTADTATAMAAIATRLDGLPLAIELAAVRVRDMPLSRMQEQLDSPLDLAVDGPRDVARRQATLRETIAWSFSLLDRQAQCWFMLLAVFAGGFTLEAMAALGAVFDLGAQEASRGLMLLIGPHLIRRLPHPSGQHGAPRYTMLETIREYAQEQLAEHGQLEDAQRAHARFFRDMAERADYTGPDQTRWYASIAAERDNIRAALDWCRDRGERETGLRLTLAMMPFWEQRNLAADSLAWVQAFMAATDELSPRHRARGLICQGLLLLNDTADRDMILSVFAEGLRIVRDEGDARGESEALRAIGDAHVHWRAWELARQHYRESLAAAERSGDARLIALAYMGLAFSAPGLDGIDGARPYWEATLAWAQRSGHQETIGKATNSLGELARHREDWDTATDRYEQSLAIGQELGSDFLVALASHNLGYAAIGRRDLGQATARFTESLRIYRGLWHRKGMAECLAGLARVAVLDGDDERAARLCGAAATLLDETRTQFDTMDRADYERTLATLRDRLGPRLAVLLVAGRAMSYEDAMAFALGAWQTIGE
ncbi:MAG: tetratricopeptide repeat protein [Thermomicrobiales bacterium]